ncbi:MAG: 50S ribosomal protein L2 [Candidatus Diapherotrites archaeon]
MGKRIEIQRRGKGGPVWTARKKGRKSSYPPLEKGKDVEKGQIVEFSKEIGRNALLARVLMDSEKEFYVVAAEGVFLGQEIEMGRKAEIKIGNILPLSEIPEGCPVFNIEMRPGDGGKLVRATGSYSLLVSKNNKTAVLRLPSGKNKEVLAECRASIGNVACGERTEKPFIKAGAKFHYMKAKSRPWPVVRGVAKNALDHPFGGAQHHAGKSKSVSRNAPPGRKVGAIASRRTGRRKK